MSKVVLAFFVIGIIALLINVIMTIAEVRETFMSGFVDGVTIGIAIGSMILGILYITGAMLKVMHFKRKILHLE